MAESRARLAFSLICKLWQGGMRFGGFIDAGCADGQFSLLLAEHGPLRGGAILNVDALEDYRASLESLREALGAHYRICALADKDGGSIEFLRGGHPYWSSVRPAGDPYWDSVNRFHAPAPLKLPRRTIDSLVAETLLPGPYLLKLDIQGAEAAALRGAKRTLRNTEAVVVEILLEDFDEIHDVLRGAGMFLFDISQFIYTPVDTVFAFYAIYLSGRRRDLLRQPMYDAALNEQMVSSHDARRQQIRQQMAQSLERLRSGQWPDLAK